MPRKFEAKLTGISDLMFGRKVTSVKQNRESHDAFEQRVWREKVATNEDGQVTINPFAIKNGLVSAASFMQMSIKGRGKSTFTKRFRCGILCVDPIPLVDSDGAPVRIDDVEPITLFVPANGKPGNGTRVDRVFPTLHEWGCQINVIVLDDLISEEVFTEHLRTFGQFIGVGAMRVENGGINGRFACSDIVCSDLDLLAAA